MTDGRFINDQPAAKGIHSKPGFDEQRIGIDTPNAQAKRFPSAKQPMAKKIQLSVKKRLFTLKICGPEALFREITVFMKGKRRFGHKITSVFTARVSVLLACAAGGPCVGQRQRDLSLWTPFLRCGGE